MSSRRDRLETEFLPEVLELEESPSSPLGRAVVWGTAVIAASAVTWACLGRVDTVAVARGRLVPDGEAKTVQPLREGVIRAVLVREGARVSRGQVLIELDPTLGEADLGAKRRLLAIQQGERARLRAELVGAAEGRGAPLPTPEAGDAGAVARLQRDLLVAKDAEHGARAAALALVVTQREAELAGAEAGLAKLEALLPLLREREERYRRLFEQGITPRIELLEKQEQLVSAEHDRITQGQAVGRQQEALAEARRNLEVLGWERERSALAELVALEKSLAALEGELAKAAREHELDTLVAPVEGFVHELAATTVGGVVRPAQVLAAIVPAGMPLVVEAKALQTDVGFLAPGQAAEVKIDTFPFQKYGTIPARLVAISPDAVEDERLGPVYKVKAAVDAASVWVEGRRVALTPGLTVSLEIKTGRRRIIEFFLSPIAKVARESLTVR